MTRGHTTFAPPDQRYATTPYRLGLLAMAAVAAAFLAVPYFVPPGAVFALLSLAGIVMMAQARQFTLLSCLGAFWAYLLAVCYLSTGSRTALLETNAPVMVQMAVATLTCAVFLRQGSCRPSATRLALVILSVASASIAAERAGYDVKPLIPSRYADSARYSEGTVVYESGEARFRGVYPEASAVGAVCGTFLGLSLLLASTRPITRAILRHKAVHLAIAFLALCTISLTLTKSGLFICCAGILLALIPYGLFINRAKGLLLLATTVVVVALGVAAVRYGPDEVRNYMDSELETLQAMYSGAGPEGLAGKGMFARSEGLMVGITSLYHQPMGGPLQGYPQVAKAAGISTTLELNRDYAEGIYGLKSSLANMLYQGGVAALLFQGIFLWLLFLRGKSRARSIPLARYFGIFSTIALWISVENRYYYLALPVIVAAIIEEYENRVFNLS